MRTHLQKSRAHKRRSTRVQLKVPVTVSGIDSSGFRFEFLAETIMVSKHGARLRTKRLPDCLCLGSEICVALPRGRESRTGQVVWMKGGTECGVELQDPIHFWGVAFPPRDGEEFVYERRHGKSAPASREQAPASFVDRPLPSKSNGPSAPLSDIPAESAGSLVLVTGISSTHSLFQERTMFTAVGGYEGSVVMRQPVTAGASLRVVIGGRPVKACVMSVQRDLQPNKSLVRLKFTEPIGQEQQRSFRDS